EASGISECVPRRRKNLSYRVSLEMGRCSLTEAQVLEILDDMGLAWPGPEYNEIHNNSLDFADALLQQLGVGGLPREPGGSSPSYLSGCNARIWKPLEQTCSIDFSVSGLFKGAVELGYGVMAMLTQPFTEDPDGDRESQADHHLFCQSVACTDDDNVLLATEPATTSLDLEFPDDALGILPDSSDVLHELEVTVARNLAVDREAGTCLLSSRSSLKAWPQAKNLKCKLPETPPPAPPQTSRETSFKYLPSVGTWYGLQQLQPKLTTTTATVQQTPSAIV
ncbi:desi2, partial [Symbiodinium pilosum]